MKMLLISVPIIRKAVICEQFRFEYVMCVISIALLVFCFVGVAACQFAFFCFIVYSGKQDFDYT
jgi:hypothetical protein